MNLCTRMINDPVHGYVKIEHDLVAALIDHPWVQRLRSIRQLGLTNLVYPGAVHTRFQHALGALHLMMMALDTLTSKDVKIKPDERLAAQTAILLHDVGHGPFSHALERTIVNAEHEEVSRIIMDRLEQTFGDALADTKRAFAGECRPFVHQLISSQLDTDRLDYLKRDSFFSGVAEGTVGSDRLIRMLTVTPQGQLALEVKGLYTIEDFLVARRMMYWQVYLHRTVVAAEQMLRAAVIRARHLAAIGHPQPASPTLDFFLRHEVNTESLENEPQMLQRFCELGDDDVTISLKMWAKSDDKVLSILSKALIERQIFVIEMTDAPSSAETRETAIERTMKNYDLTHDEASLLVMTGSVSSKIYNYGVDRINILLKDGSVRDFADLSDIIKTGALGGAYTRHFICYPREQF